MKENYQVFLLILITILISFWIFLFNKSKTMKAIRDIESEMWPFIKVLNLMEKEKIQKQSLDKEIEKYKLIKYDLTEARFNATANLYWLTWDFNFLTWNNNE